MTDEDKRLDLSDLGDPTLLFPHVIARRLDPKWEPYTYLVRVSNTFVEFITIGDARILMCWHPRAGKTMLLTFLIIWHLRIWPHKNIIFSSHSEDFSTARVRNIRQIIIDNQNVLGIRLAEDNSRADEFATVGGGGLFACGIGSSIIGRSADLLVIDDIYGSWEDSQNPKVRRRVVDWFTGTAHTRLEPKGSIVVSGARWHSNDFQDYLLNNSGESWHSFIFPAVSEGPEKDPLGRAAGTPLCPRFTLEALERKREAIGGSAWMSQFQQSPLPESESGVGIVFPKEVIAKIGASPLPHLSRSSHSSQAKAAIRYIGLDPGLKRSHFAYCLIERVETETQNEPEFHILDLRRYELGKSIHEIIHELDQYSKDVSLGEISPIFVTDASGAGGEILLEIMRRQRIVPIIPLTIVSHGSKNKFTVSKTMLVENFLNLISADRVKIADGIPHCDLLFGEMRIYRFRPSPQGRTTTYYSAGSGHDDILDSLMIATYAGAQNWTPLYRPTVGAYGRVSRRWISGNRGGLRGDLNCSLYAERDSDYVESEGCAS